MENLFQNTIAQNCEFQGVGLHTGEIAKVKLIPAEANTGIIFKRTDIANDDVSHVQANFENVSCANLCTTLSNKHGNSVSTVEHLMAALYISGIDNLVIEIDKKEVPILDGSSKTFLKLIKNAGLIKQKKKKKIFKSSKKDFYYGKYEKNINIPK